ncbi:PREDICTED: ubiquitin carboxyl-terminal hydrolase 8-like isoform X2 [Lupinus angustifolius]|uniref:ubiquitin carboxyl-terminal hydrolase 8-like isoform X2 n=1 Tax=Lupinus angustifolius TaxID=3871 RepID=UPI00092F8CF3|nr:PREDICTED: ubiquitin carboxyl-terminal hydrolase 8-like isoform X2 [Lupinus angustifolius]
MTRLSSSLTRFLSLLSLSTLRLFNSLSRVFKLFFSMDSSPYNLRFNDPDFGLDRVYLLPHRWWSESQCDGDRVEGVLYTVLCNSDSEFEILLHLKKEEDCEKIKRLELGFSGRQYALVSEGTWLRALKRNNATQDFGSLLHSESEDCLPDLFPLQLGIFVSWETNSLVAKISQKENGAEFYKKACYIFNSDSNPMQIWDFSGQTTQLFMNDKVNLPENSTIRPENEVLLELQVHGLSDSVRENGCSEMIADRSQMECSSHSGSVMMNGCTESVICNVKQLNSFRGNICKAIRSLGLTGLQNLGNTCFMNSAIQCLAHTPKLVDFFLGEYSKEINYENPLGMNGELALSFGDLLRRLWVPGANPVSPRTFKMKLGNFAPRFSGYSQHDTQELLAFLLDGLHEDLNRVKRKPYHEVKDADGRPDDEVAEEYWRNYLARNDSVVVDLFQGQFRSTLVCPMCKKVSVTFDPFMYLSLPLPSTTMRTMTLTVMSTDGITMPSVITITVPERGTLKDLVGALSASCSLGDDETLLVAEIYKNRVYRFFEEPSDSLADIRDIEKLAAYRLQKNSEASPLVVFVHELAEKYHFSGKERFDYRSFGIPVMARLSNISDGDDVRREFLKLINPFMISNEDILDECDKEEKAIKKLSEDDEMGETSSSAAVGSDEDSITGTEDDFEFYLPGVQGIGNVKIKLNEPLPFTVLPGKLEVLVIWSDKMLKKYDTYRLNMLPEVCKPQQFTKRTQESISIYKCLEAFLKEEPLGPEDMWHCPTCKEPQQATKKLDLWRLPEILVVHLKRFSYSRFFKNKLQTFVDFPINDLDFSSYIARGNNQSSNGYMLYAISCHYGGLGGGHYTAFVRYGHDTWYEFDDSRVIPVSEEMIKTDAAYVLFYKKVQIKT